MMKILQFGHYHRIMIKPCPTTILFDVLPSSPYTDVWRLVKQ